MKKSKFIHITVSLFIFMTLSVIAFADPPKLYSADGKYLGNLSTNRYDTDSVANPYGRYGSRYSTDSINNPYGRYGSRYSNESANNPFATSPPRIIHFEDNQ